MKSLEQVSIAQVMMVVALAAPNLAVARATPWAIASYPTIWVAMGILDFIIFWKLILRRSFRAFQYTFLIVLFVAFIILINLVARESLHPLGPFVRWYQRFSNNPASFRSLAGIIFWGELWTAALLSILLAFAAGIGATWLERRWNWDIAAFWRGSLLGVLIAAVIATIEDWACGWVPVETLSLRWACNMGLLAAGVIFGGWIGYSRLKSRRPEPKGRLA